MSDIEETIDIDVNDIIEYQLCYYDVLKYAIKHDENFIKYDTDENYKMKLFSLSVSNFLAIQSGTNFRYGLSNLEKIKNIKTCLICNKDFKDTDVCRTPNCQHLFHATCICSLENKETGELKCPICKTLIEDYYLPYNKFTPEILQKIEKKYSSNLF